MTTEQQKPERSSTSQEDQLSPELMRRKLICGFEANEANQWKLMFP